MDIDFHYFLGYFCLSAHKNAAYYKNEENDDAGRCPAATLRFCPGRPGG